jgi:hypothetical protein
MEIGAELCSGLCPVDLEGAWLCAPKKAGNCILRLACRQEDTRGFATTSLALRMSAL